ncbi:MAG: hypothetical protein ACK504_00785 [Bacteroidota bacterium]
MKKLFFLTIVFSSSVFSQTIKYSFSSEYQTINTHIEGGFYQLNKNEYGEVYYREGRDMIFQVFDKDFKNLKKQETAILPANSKKFVYENFFNLQGNIYWFYSTWEKKTKTEKLFALPLDKNSLTFSAPEINLIEAHRIASGEKYHFYPSADSSKILVTYRLKPKEKRDQLNKDIIGFNLFDRDLKKLFASEIEMPYSEAEMNNLDYEIDSKGNIYLLAEVNINNSVDGIVRIDKENKSPTRYELIRVNQKNSTLQAIKINLKEKFTNSVILSEDFNHNIIIAGYYSNKKNSNSSDGAYIIKLELDENNSVKNLQTTYCEFPAETLQAFEKDRIRKRMEKKNKKEDLEAYNLSFDQISFYEDGSMLIVGEEYYVVTYVYNTGRSIATSYTYYYNDILALKADKNGKTIWCKKIPKQQFGSTIEDLSFHHHRFKGEDYFFYLDNVKNINLSLDEYPLPHQAGLGGYLTCVKIDQEGRMTKKNIFDIREEDIRIFPKQFEFISENIIVGRIKSDRRDSKILKLEFN